MRAKFIYEKFEEDSDPIRDLGIGLYKICSDFFEIIENRYAGEPEAFIHNCLYIKNYEHQIAGFMYEYGTRRFIYSLFQDKEEKIKTIEDVKEFLKSNKLFVEQIPIEDIRKMEYFIKRKPDITGDKRKNDHHKKIYEKFTSDSDPIRDLGIGLPIIRVKQGDILSQKRGVFSIYTDKKIGTSYQFVFDGSSGDNTEDAYWIVYKLIKNNDDKIYMILIPWASLHEAKNFREDIRNCRYGSDPLKHLCWDEGTTDWLTWDSYFKIVKE